MLNAEAMSDPGPRRSERDPFTGMFVAMRDAWLASIAAPKENISGQSTGGGNPGAAFHSASLMGPMIGMLGAMADLATPNRERFAEPGAEAAAHSPLGGQENSVAASFVLPMGCAMMIAGNRSVSYWLNLAQILVSHQARSVQAPGVEAIDRSAAGSERLAAVDELRTLLREVGELATREARLLQNELGTLGESLGQSLQQSDPSGSYRRRWRSKV